MCASQRRKASAPSGSSSSCAIRSSRKLAATTRPRKRSWSILPAAICGAIEKNEDVDYLQVPRRCRPAARLSCALRKAAGPHSRSANACRSDHHAADGQRRDAGHVRQQRVLRRSGAGLSLRAGGRLPARNSRRPVSGQSNTGNTASRSSSRPLVECVFPLAVMPAQAELSRWASLSPGAPWSGCQLSRRPVGRHPLVRASARRRSAANPVPLVIAADVPLVAGTSMPTTIQLAAAAQRISVPAASTAASTSKATSIALRFEAKKGRGDFLRGHRPPSTIGARFATANSR